LFCLDAVVLLSVGAFIFWVNVFQTCLQLLMKVFAESM
jgi:hypothetical protein